ncbi:GNAT family N-acetyltransferase [Clostridium tagluense]|uniref:N-acetyltransferase domain-containing protein n=1 Tax=Clostridium tagluense TaxID=360422 RepID=A0A401UUB9_9CLOT|nr:GNAT family N-acetyltransferase [Clostridium tagluense]GCD13143.1 hypothetical protein Ctaglu_47660 [Clostridium tagluense]
MKLNLKKLSTDDGRMIYDMLQEIESNDNGFHNAVKGMSYEECKIWLRKNADMSEGIGLKEWMVPQTSYWMFIGEMPVGYGRIRHFLNDNLEANSGHIGYAIPSSHRGKGYGNELLALLLKECDKLKISTVQIGANKNNERSNKVIVNNAGILVKETCTKNIYLIYRLL